MLKLIIFDMDGVLVDACNWHEEAFNKALKEVCGFELSKEEHTEKFNGLPTKEKIKILVERGRITNEIANKLSELKQKYTVELIEKNSKEDKTKIDLIDAIKKEGIKVACCTNSIRKTAELMLEKVGVLKKLDLLVTNQDVKNPKPNPECFLKAISSLKVLPEECIIVEDSPKGLEAAFRTGCTVIKVENATAVNRLLFRGLL